MFLFYVRPCAVVLSAVCLFLASHSFAETAPIVSPLQSGKSSEVFAVYKSPTCGCCGAWVDHINDHGIPTLVQHPADLNAIKDQFKVAPQYQSCHTAVSPDGYVFEGHIPANIIQRFLKEKPAGALGLAVPGMPLGSPGMEVDGRFTPYDVMLLKQDGSTAVYVHIASPADQKGGL